MESLEHMYYNKFKALFEFRNKEYELEKESNYFLKYWIRKRDVPLGKCEKSFLVDFLLKYEFSVLDTYNIMFDLKVRYQDGFYVVGHISEGIAIVENDTLKVVDIYDVSVLDNDYPLYQIKINEYEQVLMEVCNPAHKILDILLQKLSKISSIPADIDPIENLVISRQALDYFK
ncbi:MAG: hypothetical protein U0T32_14635 [Chitinophagales bacterium]